MGHFLNIILNLGIHGRVLRERRQTGTNNFGQDVNNAFSYGYNAVRDNVGPAISSATGYLSQNWDRYKQNINQGINQGINQAGQAWDIYKQNLNQGVNQLSQGWNRFTQNFNPQNPYNTNNNYGYYRKSTD